MAVYPHQMCPEPVIPTSPKQAKQPTPPRSAFPPSPSRTNPSPLRPSPLSKAGGEAVSSEKSTQLFWTQFPDSPAYSPGQVATPQHQPTSLDTTTPTTLSTKRRYKKSAAPKEKNTPKTPHTATTTTTTMTTTTTTTVTTTTATTATTATTTATTTTVTTPVGRKPRTPRKKPLPQAENPAEEWQTRMIIRTAGRTEARLMPKRNMTVTTAARKRGRPAKPLARERPPPSQPPVTASPPEEPRPTPPAHSRMTRSTAAKLLNQPAVTTPPIPRDTSGTQPVTAAVSPSLEIAAVSPSLELAGTPPAAIGLRVPDEALPLRQLFGEESGDESQPEVLDMESGSSSEEDNDDGNDDDDDDEEEGGEAEREGEGGESGLGMAEQNSDAATSKKRTRGGSAQAKKQSKRQARRSKRLKEREAKQKSKEDKEKTKYRPECKFWENGACKNGDKCAYAHVGTPVKSGELCRYFLIGGCLKGANCMYSHNLSSTPCQFFHFRKGGCTDPNCAFSHAELSAEQLKQLQEEELSRQQQRQALHRDPRQTALDNLAFAQPFAEP